MPTSKEDLPPLKNVQTALRAITETLARELAHPSADAPNWSASEWRVARAVVVLHGIASLLARRLRWRGPPGWEEFLADQRVHTERRQLRVNELLRTVDSSAREAGIGFVALKGTALYEAGFYRLGERPMADLDLLVAPLDVESMSRILDGIQYHVTAVTWKHRVFEASDVGPPAPFGEHFRNGIKIDLHSRIRELLPHRPIEVSNLILPLKPAPGLNSYRSHAALMLHLLLHAAGAIVFRTLRLVQLHDMALLSERLSEADWERLVTCAAAARCGLWWAHEPLRLVAHYYQTIPAHVLTAAASECRASFLRRTRNQSLWQVSFSDLRRSVFPGIGWSLSAGDALAYAAERIQVTLQALARILFVGTIIGGVDGIAGREGLCSPSNGWIALRPARLATLSAVRHAFAQPR